MDEKEPVYGYCTGCRSIEAKLNQQTHTVDFSNIGESEAYPAGLGCENCD